VGANRQNQLTPHRWISGAADLSLCLESGVAKGLCVMRIPFILEPRRSFEVLAVGQAALKLLLVFNKVVMRERDLELFAEDVTPPGTQAVSGEPSAENSEVFVSVNRRGFVFVGRFHSTSKG
jgi:hypothetical protein